MRKWVILPACKLAIVEVYALITSLIELSIMCAGTLYLIIKFLMC